MYETVTLTLLLLVFITTVELSVEHPVFSLQINDGGQEGQKHLDPSKYICSCQIMYVTSKERNYHILLKIIIMQFHKLGQGLKVRCVGFRGI